MSRMNQVRVTKLLGGGATGSMDPVLGLTTDQGVIVGLGHENETVSVSGSHVMLTEDLKTFYPHQLFVTETVASGVPYLYPSGSYNAVVFGAQDVPSEAAHSQMVYAKGGVPTVFTP